MRFLIIFISTFLFALTNYQYQKILGLGIDADWANQPKEIRYYTSKIPKDFKQKGFDTVRLRIDFYQCKKNKHNPKKMIVKKRPFSDEEYLNIIKKVVNDSLNNHLNVVLSYGACKYKENPSNANEKELINHWILLAKTFKNYPYTLSYDLIIEPGRKLNRKYELLNDFYKKAYKALRKIDKKRILMWAPTRRSNPRFLEKTWYPKNDNYIMAEWHMYAAGPKPDYKRVIPLKTKIAYKWSVKNHIPTWLGAWMPGNYNHGDNYSEKEQIIFSKFMIENLAKYHIPFSVNADKQFYNIKDKRFEYRLTVLESIIKYYKKEYLDY